MKKLIILLLATAISLTLAACKGNSAAAPASSANATVSTESESAQTGGADTTEIRGGRVQSNSRRPGLLRTDGAEILR